MAMDNACLNKVNGLANTVTKQSIYKFSFSTYFAVWDPLFQPRQRSALVFVPYLHNIRELGKTYKGRID
jgi:hypothetical protein